MLQLERKVIIQQSFHSGVAAIVLLAILMIANPVMAVRPFITDDARVVGDHLLGFETSLRWDQSRLQNLNLLAIGLSDKLEGTVGFVHGLSLEGDSMNTYGITGPLLQLKYLFTEGTPNRWPGFALIGGVVPPYGSGGFIPPRWSEFIYLAVTESLFEKDRLMLHGNFGTFITQPDNGLKTSTTWGIGAQLRLIGGLHAVGEIFSGDPYAESSGGAFQAGFRYFISDKIQLDATIGSGLWGDPRMDTWLGAGLRFITDRLW